MKVPTTKSMVENRLVCCVFGLSAALTCVLVSSCATNREDLVRSGHITLQKHRTGKVYIAWCDLYRDEDGLIVKGVLRRRDHIGFPVRAHVNVSVMSPDGSTIQEACSKDIYVPRRVTGRSQSLQRFNVRLPEIPPCGSLIRLVASSGVS